MDAASPFACGYRLLANGWTTIFIVAAFSAATKISMTSLRTAQHSGMPAVRPGHSFFAITCYGRKRRGIWIMAPYVNIECSSNQQQHQDVVRQKRQINVLPAC